MPNAGDPRVTVLLQNVGRDADASAKLLPLVYEELRAIARDKLRSERAGHTLQATALVHEAYLKLLGSADVQWQGRAHFFGACANAMRQILVDHARGRGAKKRGGGRAVSDLSHDVAAGGIDLDLILSVDDVLEKLRAEDDRAAQIVELRFFAGLEIREIADLLQSSERTVAREWAFARTRLIQLLQSSVDA